ncbi:hypothetical protein [Gallaecimonas mangrovi]|uniref:hypothetical protein n=1 Tax=Gallaecimonas mangrovi TaxID=2291597 RepID=UPI000E205CE4|nr:hypothetical protein [Gallaecimonas mangrovi]
MTSLSAASLPQTPQQNKAQTKDVVLTAAKYQYQHDLVEQYIAQSTDTDTDDDNVIDADTLVDYAAQQRRRNAIAYATDAQAKLSDRYNNTSTTTPSTVSLYA